MGSSCSSSSSTKTAFRFKNFVVAVYPTDHDGELNNDALGKLISYVANNVERIPRVCRKISKLVDADLKRGDIKRVSIGMQILRRLLDEATELDAYCPYVTSLCLTLFERGVVEHRISAADVLTALCHRIVERSDERSEGRAPAFITTSVAPVHPNFMTSMSKNNMEHARRLVADAKDRFATYLKDMLVEGVATNDIISLHCRYAATVALGNLAYCIQGSLPAASLVDLIPPVLSNLHHLLREAAASMSSRVNQRRRQRKENISAMSDDSANDFRAPNTVILPVEAGEKDAAFYKASVATISSLAMCCNTTNVTLFLTTVSQYLTTYHGWLLSRFPLVVFRSITSALQHKPQQPLGVNACAHLCDLAEEKAGTAHFASVLRALATSVAQIPMSGGRPTPVIGVLMSALTSGFCLRPSALQHQHSPPQDTTTSSAVMFDDYRQALCRLCETLVKRMVSHNNLVQISKFTTELCGLLRSSGTLPRIALTTSFQMLMVVCPFVADIAMEVPSTLEAGSIVVDTSSATNRSSGLSGAHSAARVTSECLCVASSHLVVHAIAAYLLSSDGEICGLAAQVLATMIGSTAIDSPGQSVTSRSSAGGQQQQQLIAPTLSPTLLSIIDDAKCWISYATFRTTEHTPLSIIGVTNLITSLVSRLKWESLSFVLPWIVHVQQLNAVGHATSPPNQATSSRATSSRQSSTDKNTALQQAWLFASVAVLKVVGDFLHVSSLSSYASDVINRRRETEPCEIGLWFRPTVLNCTPSTSGMAEEPGEQDTQLAPLVVAGVTNLFTLSTVVLYLCGAAESATFLRSLETTKDEAVAKIESIAADVQHPQRQYQQQRKQRDGMTPRHNSSAVHEGTPSNLAIKRSGSTAYSSSSNTATGGGRIPINHSFGDLTGKREDSSVLSGTNSAGFHTSSNSSFGTVVLPRGGAPSTPSNVRVVSNADEDIPASEKIRLVLQKLKLDSAGAKSVPKSNLNASLPFEYNDDSATVLTPSSIHMDPWKDSGSKNNSFTMSMRDSDRLGGLNGSIVMPTAKTLRLAQQQQQRPLPAFYPSSSTFGATLQTTPNDAFEVNGIGVGSNPVRRRFLQVLEL
jgi:hypothetical protein